MVVCNGEGLFLVLGYTIYPQQGSSCVFAGIMSYELDLRQLIGILLFELGVHWVLGVVSSERLSLCLYLGA